MRAPQLPLLQPTCVTLLKPLKPLIKEESVELSRRKLISGDGHSGAKPLNNTSQVLFMVLKHQFPAGCISAGLREPVHCGPNSEGAGQQL